MNLEKPPEFGWPLNSMILRFAEQRPGEMQSLLDRGKVQWGEELRELGFTYPINDGSNPPVGQPQAPGGQPQAPGGRPQAPGGRPQAPVGQPPVGLPQAPGGHIPPTQTYTGYTGVRGEIGGTGGRARTPIGDIQPIYKPPPTAEEAILARPDLQRSTKRLKNMSGAGYKKPHQTKALENKSVLGDILRREEDI